MYNFLNKQMISLLMCILVISLFACEAEEAGVFNDTDSLTLFVPKKDAQVYDDIYFEYSEFDSKYVNVAIFKREISVNSDNKVENWEDCIGGIHTNMPHYYRGKANLSDMRLYSMDSMDFSGSEITLTIGESYYWCVWGLNDKVTKIIESSPSYKFTYIKKPLTNITLNLPLDQTTVNGNVSFEYQYTNTNSDTIEKTRIVVFSNEPAFNETDRTIDMQNSIGGIETGMNYFTNGKVLLNDMRPYSSVSNDFPGTTGLTLTPGQTYYWIVLTYLEDKVTMSGKSSISRFIYSTP